MATTKHTITITYCRSVDTAPDVRGPIVQHEIESIEIDGEDMAVLTTKATLSEAERHAQNIIDLLEP